MAGTRKIAAILVADVVGYSRLAGADEDRTLARLRGLRSDLIDPAIDAHHGRIVKRTGDGILVELRSVVDAVRCAIEVQQGLIERNAGLPPERRIEFRVGIHLGDVVEEADGDLMGDGVNIAARLEGIAKPGGICLSEQTYWQVKGRQDLAVTDLGPTQLKNIADPVRVYSLEVGNASQAKATQPIRRSSLAPLGLGFAALIVLAAGCVWYFVGANRTAPIATSAPTPVASNAGAPAEAKHLSIVVLPFTNLSGDPAQDYFADGVTENPTTELSRIRDSFVIARSTAFTYKGRNVDAKEIGKELGVRYVLEGSVQRDQGRVRVNAQLVDAETGAHLWADRFEEDVADLFKLQDQVVARLANALGYELTRAEAEKGGRSVDPDAVDLSMRGWTVFWRELQQPMKEKRESVYEAQALFDRALQIDPNNPDALAGSAITYYTDYIYGWGDPSTDYEVKALGQASRAIDLAPDNVRAYYVKAMYLRQARRSNEALGVANAGLAINPNYAPLYLPRGLAEVYLGRPEQAKTDAERAMRLISPRDPFIGVFHLLMGDAELVLGHSDGAIDQLRQANDSGFRTYTVYDHLAAAYALAGKMDEAKAALAEAGRLNPKVTVKWMIERGALSAVVDGVRKAGLAEE